MRLLYLLLVLAISTSAYCQDIIVKNDKTEIKAKIEEITETTIKYKKFDMLDGPTYNINVRDVFMIIYKNGTKEYMTVTEGSSNNTIANKPVSVSTTNPTNQASSPSQQGTYGNHGVFKKVGGRYEFEGERFRAHSDFINTFEKYGYNDLAKKYKEGRNFGYIGGVVVLVTTIVGLIIKNDMVIIGGALAGGIGAFALSFPPRKSAIQQFNRRATIITDRGTKLDLKPSFNYSPSTKGAELKLTVGF